MGVEANTRQQLASVVAKLPLGIESRGLVTT
jgi:hypothetical protein